MLVINFYLFTCGKFIKKRKKICLVFWIVGRSQDVYPSEELVLDKKNSDKKGKKSKILFSVGEVAAMHSQKIGNAIRSIDTYPKPVLRLDTHLAICQSLQRR
jgi:hypothetical protein